MNTPRALVPIAALCLAACSGSERSGLDGGGSTSRDAGAAVDTGSGPTADSGVAADSGAPRDGGAVGDGGDTDGGTPDAGLRCTYSDFTPATQSALRSYDDRATIYTAASSERTPNEIVSVEVYYDLGANDQPHTFTFTGENYATCHTCVILGRGCGGEGCDQLFLLETGTLRLDAQGEPHNPFTGVINEARAVEVIIDPNTFQSTPILSGDTWCIGQLDLGATVLASVVAAGEILVDLDGAHPNAGTASWPNLGALGGAFTEVGDPIPEQPRGPAKGVTFDGIDDAYEGPITVPTIEGNDDRSIEVWVYNPTVDAPEETIVSWAERGGPEGTHLTFNFGSSPDFGAAAHWGKDIGWGRSGPQAGFWEYIVYVYDGTTATVWRGNNMPEGAVLGPLDTKVGLPINLGAQRNMGALQFTNEFNPSEQQAGSLTIGALRIHSGVLTREQMEYNFTVEADRFPTPP